MSNQVESYKKVIDVVASDLLQHYGDVKDILTQIAKTNPQVVVDAVDAIQGKGNVANPAFVSRRVKDLLLEGRKIEAIKQHRQDTGLSLKEAKDAVEQVIQNDVAVRRVFENR